MAKAKNKKPQKEPVSFFEKTWVTILILLIFAPAGIFLLWKHKKFDPAIRLLLSALFGFVFIYNVFWLPNVQPKSSEPDTVQTDSGSSKDAFKLSPAESSSSDNAPQPAEKSNPSPQQANYVPPVLPSPEFSTERLLRVHFLDVGQAESILIQTPGGKAILVDGGNQDDAGFIADYLKSLGIRQLYSVVATHPHEDHIGGLETLLKQFPVENIYMPKVSHTTKTFEDFIKAVEESKAQKIYARVGKNIPTGEHDLAMVFLAPNSSKYEELNNYSAVLKVTYRDISFLLTGDAEEVSEKEMLEYNRNVNATVLKVGHHGSSSSSISEFLAAVKPKYAVISCGKDNEYGYPHTEVIDRLKAVDAGILRLDKLGTILMETDGQKLGIKKLNP